MQQALAMIDSGQQGPASAILLRLGSKPSLLGDRSKAILATLKLPKWKSGTGHEPASILNQDFESMADVRTFAGSSRLRTRILNAWQRRAGDRAFESGA